MPSCGFDADVVVVVEAEEAEEGGVVSRTRFFESRLVDFEEDIAECDFVWGSD